MVAGRRGRGWHALLLIAVALLAASFIPARAIQPRPAPGTVAPPCRPVPGAAVFTRTGDDDHRLPPVGPPPPPPGFATILKAFCAFDLDRDGTPEINSLTPLFAGQEPYAAARNGVDIIFVEPRLVAADPTNGVTRFEMLARLDQLRQDLIREGYYPYFVLADVYAGERHQDGRTLLAMRRVLQRVNASYPLKATLLIGSFPDASILWTFLVRQVSPKDAPEQLTAGAHQVVNYAGPNIAIDSQIVTTRGEIVLADLDGNWERLYAEHLNVTDYRFLPPPAAGAYPQDDQVFQTDRFGVLDRSFDDVFHIVDHSAAVTRQGNVATVALHGLAGVSPEATAADQAQPARLARPEIAVGRLNPLSIAVQPYGSEGASALLDGGGAPQSVFGFRPSVRWRRDPTLERRLIADYLGRAHAFRLGRDHAVPLTVSSIRGPDHGLTAPADFDMMLRKAFPPLAPVQSLTTDDATPAALIAWFRKPAVLRGIAAHSDNVASYFADAGNAGALAFLAGGYPPRTHVWRWVPPDTFETSLDPSFAGMTGVSNFHLYRTIWENKLLADGPQMFIVHDGCEVMRFAHSETAPYNHPLYGQVDDGGTVSNGESLMFYVNGLGLMARNKVFNDTPSGFSDAIRTSGGRFGYGWKGYFWADAANPALDERSVDPTSEERRYRTLQRKRSYFWNMIGDPTLKLHY